MIKRRQFFDLNTAYFEGWPTSTPVLGEAKRYDGTMMPFTEFTLNVNSNPYSNKAVYSVPLYAYRWTALALCERVKKGSKLFIQAEWKPRKIKADKKNGIEAQTIHGFEITKFFVMTERKENKDVSTGFEMDEVLNEMFERQEQEVE